MNNWLQNQSLLTIDQKKELEMIPDLEKEGPVASKISKKAPEQPKENTKGPQKKQRGPRNNQGKENWPRPYPQGYRSPKLEPSAMDSVFNTSRALMEFTAKEQKFSMRIIREIRYNKSIMNVKFNKTETELKKLTSNINYLRGNDIAFT
ncbi:hypothetical protein O181_041073 [Austropuccinia psidii MF-1]|uniref:Uncharacterized protein n=1 Tax=Austropuccinia psidii MF-1 TaxID=1389203 RepID=A0A9Q3DIG7_9BASI|nr:hypothetical protein [Austropuccinia psidii MF-1]